MYLFSSLALFSVYTHVLLFEHNLHSRWLPMTATSRAEAVDVLLRHCSRGGPFDAARLRSLAAMDRFAEYSECDEIGTDADLEAIRAVDDAFGHICDAPLLPPFTLRAAELWEAQPALCPLTQSPFVHCVWRTAWPLLDAGDAGGFALALQKEMDKGLAAYAARYHDGAALVAASAFIRQAEGAAFEVIAIIASAPVAAPVHMRPSLFDEESDDEDEDDKDKDKGISNGKNKEKERAPPAECLVRWTAGHVFELRVDTARAALLLRHDSAFLITNASSDGPRGHCAQRLFPVRRFRPETIPLPMRAAGSSSDGSCCCCCCGSGSGHNDIHFRAAMDRVDVKRVAAVLCARVEEVDCALAASGVAPVARATLPLLAALRGGAAGESLRSRRDGFAAAATEAAALANRRAASA